MKGRRRNSGLFRGIIILFAVLIAVCKRLLSFERTIGVLVLDGVVPVAAARRMQGRIVATGTAAHGFTRLVFLLMIGMLSMALVVAMVGKDALVRVVLVGKEELRNHGCLAKVVLGF